MCTAINYSGYFGRNLDLEYSYNEKIIITPKNFKMTFCDNRILDKGYAVFGIGIVKDKYPLYYDACNEYGIAGAGLNFSYNDLYSNEICEEKYFIAAYEMLILPLRTCKTLKEIEILFKNSLILNKDFSENLRSTNLHFMFTDGKCSITIESENGKIYVYNNSAKVLTNTPRYYRQMKNCEKYKSLTNCETNQALNSKGSGAVGLPGDYSSMSRFVRADFVLKCYPESDNDVYDFFHILDSVSVPKGAVKITEGKYFYTRYSSCIDLQKKIYYYKTYENSRINAVSLFYTDSRELLEFDLLKENDIYFQN